MGENTIGAAQAAVPNTLPAEGNPTGAPAGEGEKKTYTKEEVEQLLQQEADRRVNEAMQRAKRQKEAAVKEAEKLAAMSAEPASGETRLFPSARAAQMSARWAADLEGGAASVPESAAGWMISTSNCSA